MQSCLKVMTDCLYPVHYQHVRTMIIYVNDKPCEADAGDLLLHAAQRNKAHIGCICGGNGICQSCFVYVREGAEFLSPPGEEEKAFIRDAWAELIAQVETGRTRGKHSRGGFVTRGTHGEAADLAARLLAGRSET